MLMGSTQGASLSIAHVGAFYGATVDSSLDPRSTSYSRIIKYIYSVKIKATNIFACPPTCLPTTPASRSDAHQTHCRMPQHTPFHSIVTIYDTPPLTLFSETSTSNVHCS